MSVPVASQMPQVLLPDGRIALLEAEDKLSCIQLELDMTTLRNHKFTNTMLVDQLDLHRQFNTNIPPKSWLKNKEMLLEALESAIEYYNFTMIIILET